VPVLKEEKTSKQKQKPNKNTLAKRKRCERNTENRVFGNLEKEKAPKEKKEQPKTPVFLGTDLKAQKTPN